MTRDTTSIASGRNVRNTRSERHASGRALVMTTPFTKFIAGFLSGLCVSTITAIADVISWYQTLNTTPSTAKSRLSAARMSDALLT